MTQQNQTLSQWAATARQKLQLGTLTPADLDALVAAASPPRLLQRLLYLHAAMPSIRSEVVNSALHEPLDEAGPMIDPLAAPGPLYGSVAEAVRDGWRVIHFPDQRSPFDDREIDVVGYEFVLEKMEAYDD